MSNVTDKLDVHDAMYGTEVSFRGVIHSAVVSSMSWNFEWYI